MGTLGQGELIAEYRHIKNSFGDKKQELSCFNRIYDL